MVCWSRAIVPGSAGVKWRIFGVRLRPKCRRWIHGSMNLKTAADAGRRRSGVTLTTSQNNIGRSADKKLIMKLVPVFCQFDLVRNNNKN